MGELTYIGCLQRNASGRLLYFGVTRALAYNLTTNEFQ